MILNQFFFEPLHPFFVTLTRIGDGLSIVIVVMLLMFWKFKAALFMALAGMLSGGVTQLLKNFAFPDVGRPYFYFRYFTEDNIQLVPGLDMHIHNSFPSGHTTAAFSLFTVLMISYGKPKMAWLFFLAALLVGYSRVYLSQHFLVDVLAGSFIGILFTLLVHQFIEKIEAKSQPAWFNKSLLRLK